MHNLAAANAQRQYKISTGARAKSTEKLSSGYKINRAADDAAGLGISEKMRWQIRGLNRDEKNISDGISYVQVADGALAEVDDMLHRMSELAIQSANDTNTETDRQAIDSEVQALKGELDRIFDTTSFNDKYIWHGEFIRQEVDHYDSQAAVTTSVSYSNYNPTNTNHEVLPASYMTTHADETNGVSISWTTLSGATYETDPISWDELEANNYKFEMSDYFPNKDDPSNPLFDNGQPQFKKTLSFTPNANSEVADLVSALNNTSIYVSTSIAPTAVLEDSTGKAVNKSVGIGMSMRYDAAHAAGLDLDSADDAFIEPLGGAGSSNVTSPTDENDLGGQWKIEFESASLGKITANLASVSYGSSDRSAETENQFWHWVYPYKGTPYKSGNLYSSAGNDLNNLYSALTTEYTGPTGATFNVLDKGGSLTMNFVLSSENTYLTSNGTQSNAVGSINITTTIKAGDTKEDVFNRIAQDINATTVFDMYTSSGNVDNVRVGQMSNNGYRINVPVMRNVYETDIHLDIQAGALALQNIAIDYKALNTTELGIDNLDVTSFASASQAIDAVANALNIVSEQRSYFGAMQNRMEHARAQVASTSENAQYAESRVRDTDMAKEMVNFSAQNIVAQAGESMIAQANSQMSRVLELIRQ